PGRPPPPPAPPRLPPPDPRRKNPQNVTVRKRPVCLPYPSDSGRYRGRVSDAPVTLDPAALPAPPDPPAPPARPAGKRLAWLDALRGFAALCVVFDHLAAYAMPHLRGDIYRFLDPGTYGVFVFFLVSGYIVPASLER